MQLVGEKWPRNNLWFTAGEDHEQYSRFEKGYYYNDETGCLDGPYETVEEAEKQLLAYVNWLENGDK